MKALKSTLLLFIAQQLVPVKCIPSFTINLDLPPKDRWVAVVNHYRPKLLAMTKALTPIIDKHLGKDKESWLKVDFGTEYDAELQGMIDTMNDTSVSYDMLKLTNMLYELESPLACSAVLLAKRDGTVVHGRNMDYSFHFKMPDGAEMNWPDVTFDAIFEKGGKKLLQTTMWPGGVGLSTAMRFDGWTIDQQTRMPNKWQENLKAAQNGGQPFALVLRRIMETTPKFEDALDKIYAAKFMAPMYFIMAGSEPFQGAVVTIDRLGKHLADTPPIQKLSNSTRRLVQTNDDLLHAPKDLRRPLANKILESVPQEDVGEDNMMMFMHSPPLFDLGTVYSTVMVPATGYYKTILPDEPPAPFLGASLEGLAFAYNVRLAPELLSFGAEIVKEAAQPEKPALPPRKRGLLHAAPRKRRLLLQAANTVSLLQTDFHLQPKGDTGLVPKKIEL